MQLYIRLRIGCARAAIKCISPAFWPITIVPGASWIVWITLWRTLTREAGEKLVVIGHSLGGIYARALGRRLPELIERVILLGSPIKDPFKHSNPYVKVL